MTILHLTLLLLLLIFIIIQVRFTRKYGNPFTYNNQRADMFNVLKLSYFISTINILLIIIVLIYFGTTINWNYKLLLTAIASILGFPLSLGLILFAILLIYAKLTGKEGYTY